jgi:signal transduction histidine kinase
VLYLAVTSDINGGSFAPAEAAKLLSAASPVPIYGHLETYIGQGIVAGTVYSFTARGTRMGNLVHEVMSTRLASPLSILKADPSTCMADATQLERFGLSVGQLPPGCEVRFLPPSLWRDYRWHVFTALLVILIQSALIFALVLQRRRRVQAEGEVRERRAELGQASRLALAGELAASIAHEINQPLGAILANAGAAEALLRRDPAASSEMREILADIRKADLRASEIIRRVRSLITTRQAEREPVEVNAMVSDILTFLRGDAQRRGVVIDIELTPELPTLLVDRVQMQQAVINLCVNAMEAMSDCAAERRRLGVRTAATVKGNVEVTVTDSGPGILPEYLARMFDSFFTTKAHGMGLGLAITRSIVEAHEGTLSAENRSEGGALFRIVLPACGETVR